MTSPRGRRSPGCARGMSIFELVGCLSAMVGGVLLGSMYLGVDVKKMAYAVLEQANVIDPRGNDEPATAPDDAADPTTPVTDDAPTEAEAEEDSPAPGSSDDGAPADTPPVDAPSAAPSPQGAGIFAREDLITDEQRKVLTLAYWDALAQCMHTEVNERVPAVDEEGNWQLFDYLTGRKQGHVRAAAAIGQLDRRGVDDHVLAYAKKARAWHEDGGKLFGRAVDLLTDAPTAQLSGAFAQSWQSAATQHRMEARLLAEKYQAVKSYLDHAYPSSPAVVAPKPTT